MTTHLVPQDNIDPYDLANKIAGDPTIPDEQKLAMLGEIGSSLGITAVRQLIGIASRNPSMPRETAVRSVNRAIQTIGEGRRQTAAMVEDNNRRFAQGMAKNQATWEPLIAAQWQRVLQAGQCVKETEARVRRLERE